MTKKEELLKVENLVVEYKSGDDIVQAVTDVSFTLKKGSSLGLVGETGAGKTTIAKSILRILPDTGAYIKSGDIILNGINLLKVSEKEMLKVRGSQVSMIFQDPMTALNPQMRVGEQIREAILLHNALTKKEAEVKSKQMLEMVGIPALRYKEYPHQFSGGMKQRVVIAMALACNPELLLADEPTTALDVTIQAQVLEMINKLKEEKNTSMILITHDLGVVAEACDNVAIVYAGEIVECGSKEQIFDNCLHPYTKGLFGAIPDLEKDVERLSPVPGLPPDPTNYPKGCHFCTRCSEATEECKTGRILMRKISKGHFCRCLKV